MNPSSSSFGLPIYGNVVNAVTAFASRHCAENAYVQHELHGQGIVRKRVGLWCEVDFHLKITKQPDELLAEDLMALPRDVHQDDLLGMSWITLQAHRIHIHELRPLPLGAVNLDWIACEGFPQTVAYDD